MRQGQRSESIYSEGRDGSRPRPLPTPSTRLPLRHRRDRFGHSQVGAELDWAFLAGAPVKLVEDRRHMTGSDPLLLAAGLTRCPRLSTLHVRGAQAFPLDAALRVCGHRLTTLNLGGVSAPHGFWLRALAGCPMLYAVAGALNASSDEFCRALGKHCARLKSVRFQCSSQIHFLATMRPC